MRSMWSWSFALFGVVLGRGDAQSPTCKLSVGYDCHGEDLGNAIKAGNASAEACCHLCSQVPGCAAFTYLPHDWTGDGDPTCFLKGGCSIKVLKAQGVAGEQSSPTPMPQSCVSLSLGYDCYGQDLPNGSVDGATPAACCDICSSTPGCLAFTYLPHDWSGKGGPKCFLKNGCSNKVSKNEGVAGMVPVPPVPPIPTPPGLTNGGVA